MESQFEQVYTIEDWYDGPRAGVADFRGVPHFYRSVYLDSDEWDRDEDRFELTPLTKELFDRILEAHALVQRWNAARHAGTVPEPDSDDEPLVLSGDRPRYEVLKRDISTALGELHPIATMRGHFEYKPDRVHWTPVGSARPHRDQPQT